MKLRSTIFSFAAMGLILSATALPANAQQPGPVAGTPQPIPQMLQQMQPQSSTYLRSSQLLGIPTSHCGHVIDLMMQNRLREQMGTNGTEQLHLPHLTVGMNPGDLELLCVQLVSDGTDHCGPVFQIGLKNNSHVPIGNFHVSLVGVLCRIDVHSPTASLCIPRMEACEEKHIQIQLPVTCMSMGPCHQPAAFDTVVVAIDSHDDLLECDELNNVQILKRCDIVALVTETTVEVQQGPPAVAPAVPAQPAPGQGGGPVPPQEPSPLDNIDLDNLDLESAQSLQFRL